MSDIKTPEMEAKLDLLEDARRAEKEQALLYRSLGAAAEETAPEIAQRFHDLHADEQHHLSRLTARILELGGRPADLDLVSIGTPGLVNWAALVGDRERGEIKRYQNLLTVAFDDTTRRLLEAILEVEEQHARELGGKWTMA